MASSTTTASTIEHQGLIDADNDAGKRDTTEAERDSALVDHSTTTDAVLSSADNEKADEATSQLDEAAPSSREFENAQATIDIMDSRVRTAPTSHGSMQGVAQGGRYSSYPNPPNSDNHDDLDPAALLESLASFDHTQAHNHKSTYGEQNGHTYQVAHQPSANQFENDHFASLLQAAATAGQNQENENHNHYESHARNTQPLQGWSSLSVTDQQSQRLHSQKRKHSGASHSAASMPITGSSSLYNSRNTRRKLVNEIDDGALAREHAIWGPSDHSDGEAEESSASYTPLSPSSARAAGVHSAAALFRKPTPASKKYTRPPMSKLFTSLEIGPEQFLHLQAAAKSYMLNPAHPDRYNCVGSKAKVDTDMVKLKLFGCVETFLEDEGWGERCWGANAEREQLGGQKNWRLRWPETRNKIITSVTPLMRRMVTNERQRRYANETRSKEKGGKAAKPTAPTSDGMGDQENVQLPPEIDPKLTDYHYSLTAPEGDSAPLASLEQLPSPPTTNFKVVIVCSAETSQTIDSATVVLSIVAPYHSMLDYLRPWLTKSELAKHSLEGLLNVEAVRVHLPAGLCEIGGTEDWDSAVKIIHETPWMQRAATVVVEVGVADGAAKNGSGQEVSMQQHS